MFEEKITEVISKFETLASNHGMEVGEVILSAISLEGGRNLITGVVGVGCLYAACWMFRNYARQAYRYEKCPPNEETQHITKAGLYGLLTLFLGLIALCTIPNLFDLWNWTALFSPKVALAHKILGL